MRELKILTRRLYKRDRNGNIQVFSLPVLSVDINNNDFQSVNANAQGKFNVMVNCFRLEEFVSEIPSTLFVDHALYLVEDSDGWHLSSLNQAEC